MSFFSFLQPDKSFKLFKNLKQFKRPIKNRKAEGYISVCIITVAVCMLLSLALSFISAVTAVNASKRQVRAALDGFVTGQSIEIYNGVKSYSELVSGLDSEGFTQALCDYAGLQNNGDTLRGDSNYYAACDYCGEYAVRTGNRKSVGQRSYRGGYI